MASTKKIWVANNFHVDCSGLRATSGKRQAPKATSSKLQATSGKLQASSRKRQAP
jgi:hypothetical protein